MNGHVLVVPFAVHLLAALKHRELIVRTESLETVHDAYRGGNAENEVLCLWVNDDRPLSEIEMDDGMKGIPLALYLPEMGAFKRVLNKLSLFTDCNMRIFFPVTRRENLTAARILSSLGVMCGLSFENNAQPVDWDQLSDLLYYDTYGTANHAPIEPFNYTVSHYNPQEPLYFTTPYFDNPFRFLHIDADWNIALSGKKLTDEEYIASGIEALETIEENERYKKSISGEEAYFIENKRCAYCPGWRVCRGSFERTCEKNEQCRQFFTDLLEAAEYTHNNRQRKRMWQL